MKFSEDLNFEGGLCENCDLCYIDKDVKRDMMESFPKYSGVLPFPLEKYEFFFAMKNYTETPERLELAIHCLEYLKGLQNESNN